MSKFWDWDEPPYRGDEDEESEWGGRQPSEPRCKFCGSTDVRWRQQGGRWVLFSDEPGVEHHCRGGRTASADEFQPTGD